MENTKKADILNRKLDEEQLKAVSGGEDLCKGMEHRDDCHYDVFTWCLRNDACIKWHYKYPGCDICQTKGKRIE